MLIQRESKLLQKLDIPCRLRVVLGILIIDIQAIQAIILQQLHAALDELCPPRRVHDDGVERRRVRPSADGEQELEVAVGLLEEVYGLEVAVEVGPHVVPGVAGVVDVRVRPGVREDHLSCVGVEVGEGVENVPVNASERTAEVHIGDPGEAGRT